MNKLLFLNSLQELISIFKFILDEWSNLTLITQLDRNKKHVAKLILSGY